MMFDGCVVADAVAPASTSAEPAGSDVSATSALPSSCMDGRSRRCVTVIPESNAFRSASGMDARHGDDPHRAGGCGGAVVLCRPKRSVSGCLEGQLSGSFPRQLPPRGPRPSSSKSAITFPRRKVRGSRQARTRRSVRCPAPKRAHPRCPLPPARNRSL